MIVIKITLYFLVWVEPVSDENPVEIEGFMIQARSEDHGSMALGSFACLNVGKNMGPYNCSGGNVSIAIPISGHSI